MASVTRGSRWTLRNLARCTSVFTNRRSPSVPTHTYCVWVRPSARFVLRAAKFAPRASSRVIGSSSGPSLVCVMASSVVVRPLAPVSDKAADLHLAAGGQDDAMADSRAGQPAEPSDLVDLPRLLTSYYALHPDPEDPAQQVSFGTSGHRGSSFGTAFNEDHIAATSQAIVEYRQSQGIDGPLFLAKDTHGLSEPAYVTALEVFAANGVRVLVDSRDGYTPTPSLSHAILTANREKREGTADGVVVTPSHNPPSDGGFKYNPPDGGPAGSDITKQIQERANELLRAGLDAVRRIPYARAR